jgi:hypothetical protein
MCPALFGVRQRHRGWAYRVLLPRSRNGATPRRPATPIVFGAQTCESPPEAHTRHRHPVTAVAPVVVSAHSPRLIPTDATPAHEGARLRARTSPHRAPESRGGTTTTRQTKPMGCKRGGREAFQVASNQQIRATGRPVTRQSVLGAAFGFPGLVRLRTGRKCLPMRGRAYSLTPTALVI